MISSRILGSTLLVEVDSVRGGRVTVTAEGACVLTVSANELRAGETAQHDLSPYMDFGLPRAQIGYDTPFSLTVRPGCPESRAGTITWKRVSGAPLGEEHASDSGFTFSARTETLAEALGGAPPVGLVPLSPRTRGETELEATWTYPGVATIHRTVVVAASARSRGLANVAIGTRLHFGGTGWHVASAPPGSRNPVVPHDGFGTFDPDARGAYTLEDGTGHAVRLVAGKYDETPLDCGRSDCHAGIAAVAPSSPMATILQRGLDQPFPGDYPACGIACHSVGEPGIDDGGFVSVARALGYTLPALATGGFHALPPVLRRLSGVGCQGCHGTGAIPVAESRFAILSSDVCATCHDAPPRYGHVAAFRSSRMARADADPRARTDAACVRCHTTWGALGKPAWKPPEGAAPLGLGCAACHAVHPPARDVSVVGAACAAALARDVAVPKLLEGAVPEAETRGRVCLSCHAPAEGESTPAGTAAAILYGRGGLDPSTGAALDAPAPNPSARGGCLACHSHGPDGLARGGPHGFRAVPDEKTPADPALRARALALLARAGVPADEKRPAHAAWTSLDRTTPRGRALWDVALVLEDPAADRHHAAYARELLDAAGRVLEKTGAPR